LGMGTAAVIEVLRFLRTRGRLWRLPIWLACYAAGHVDQVFRLQKCGHLGQVGQHEDGKPKQDRKVAKVARMAKMSKVLRTGKLAKLFSRLLAGAGVCANTLNAQIS
jgi:hypothetical protein